MNDCLYHCSSCNLELTADELNCVEEEIYCNDCLYDESFACNRCGERFLIDDNAGDSNTPLCNDCYSSHYTTCNHCGCVISISSAYYAEDDDNEECAYCYSCYQEYERSSYIRSYSYKPVPMFHGIDKRYFGVELEIDLGGKDEYNAKLLCNIANRYDDHIYIKTDGSLDDGLEIVTHPMSLDYHMTQMPWKELMDKALSLDYFSHKTDTCGLHVHVNRNSFSASKYIQDECIARVLYIVERFWQELLRFSRRTESQIKRWAGRYGYKSEPADILNTAKNGCRYSCVNLTNFDTIEFRIFRGTLKHNTMTATLQLVNEICNVAVLMSDEEISKLGWPDFVENIDVDKYPELITYLKERRLYVNEVVSTIYDEEE